MGQHQVRREEIFDRQPQRFEDRDLAIVSPDRQFPQFRRDVQGPYAVPVDPVGVGAGSDQGHRHRTPLKPDRARKRRDARGTRRNDHLYLTAIAEGLRGKFRTAVEILTKLVVLGVAVSFIVFGYLNFLRGFSSFRMPSLTPIASLYAAIPICGVLVALFTIEQIVNGLRNGFEHAELREEEPKHVPAIETIVTKVQRS